MPDRRPISRSPQNGRGYHRLINSTPSNVSIIMKKYLFLLVLAILGGAIAEEIDPAIPCQSNQDCIHFSTTVTNATCDKNFCTCKIGTEVKNCSSIEILRQDSKNAAPIAFRACKIDQDCKFPRGVCNTTISQCECQKDYVLSSNKQQCLKKAEKIDFACVDEKQCLAFLPNTTCSNGQCTCIPGYHYAQNTCYKIVELGSGCMQSQECSHIEDAVCNESKVCGCPAETVINMDKKRCLAVAVAMFKECNEDVQCSTTFQHSGCIDKMCQCQYNYHFESEMNRCFINKALNENCGNSYECYQEENESKNVSGKAVACLSNKCVCAENFFQDEDKCVNGAVHLAGSSLFLFVFSMLVCAFIRQI